MSSFKDLRVVDNFYQTSLFFPMPTVCISTVNPDGSINVGSYSLVFPYYVAGRDYYAMVLNCRNNSNTCQNLLRTKKLALNFIPDDPKMFKEAVRLGFPGPSKDKMPDFKWAIEKGLAGPEDPDRPPVLTDAFQVIECTWDDTLEDGGKWQPGCMDGYEGPFNNFNGITSPLGATFILKIDKILMKEKYYNAIVNGVEKGDFPPVPVDYGYRDSKNFWYTKFPKLTKPHAEPIPAAKEVDLASIRYAADRCDDKIKFTDEALMMLNKVPRPFLKTALMGCVNWAKENNVELITEEHMKEINDKRAAEKKKK
ncbi:MAG: flavin reductase [Oscillospiraceae bacterium]|nr:flavin reductase [Candidatus Limimonas coprohippi]MCQ2488598.1 flavin reductase family protein [Clostridia bacterium]